MKHTKTILLGILVLAGLQLGAMTGCVGYVGGPGGVEYGGGPWFQDGVWIEGGRGWYGGGHGGGGYIHPDGNRR